MKSKCLILISILFLGSLVSAATYEKVHIKSLKTNFQGKVYIYFDYSFNPSLPTNCNNPNMGFRVNATSDKTLNRLISLALTAKTTGNTVYVGIDDTNCDGNFALVNSLGVD